MLKHPLRTIALTTLGLAALSASARTMTIGIDLSGSNPLLIHQNFADQAARHVENAILALKPGDTVNLQSFGAREDARNLVRRSVTLDRRNRPQKIAQEVGRYLRSLPGLNSEGQSSTNLLAWLEFGTAFDCAKDGQIIVITDALESSSRVNAQRLIDGKAHLPNPDPNAQLKGCALTFYGLGAGWQADTVLRLRSEWTRWAKKAGMDFTPVIP